MIFMIAGGFLCLFTMRECLKLPLPLLILLVLALGILYYLCRVVSWLGILPFLVIAFFVYRLAVREQPAKMLFIMMVVITYLLFSNSVFFLFEGSAYTWDWDDLDTVLLGFATSLPFMTWLLRCKLWPVMRDLDTVGIRWLWIIPSTFMTLNVILCSSQLQSLLDPELTWPYTALTTLFALATTYVSLLVLDMLIKYRDVSRYENDLRIIDGQLAVQAKRYEEISLYMEDVRMLRHDMRHHLRTLCHMLGEGRYDNAIAYLHEYEAATQAVETGPLCENYVVDLVVRRYQLDASEQGVSMNLRLAIPAQFWVSDTDLCIVLGNGLENALKACEKINGDSRFIMLEVRCSDKEMRLTLDNSCLPEVDSEHMPTGLSDSPDIRSGLGIPSIKAIAEKYGGMAVFSRENGVFHVRVLLYRQDAQMQM